MKIRLTGVIVFVGCMMTGDIFTMELAQEDYQCMREHFAPDREERIHRISPFEWVNDQDEHGHTYIHYYMTRKNANVAHIKFLVKHGARLDIKNDWGESPYEYGIRHTGRSPRDESKKSCFYNTQAANFVHSKLLEDKLQKIVTK